MMTSKSRMPTTTVHLSRLRLFQPTRRPVHLRDEVSKSSWGTVIVNGRLGQRHADLMSAIFFHAQKVATDREGKLKILIDPAEISRSTRLEGSGLKDTARELFTAVVKIVNAKQENLCCVGHLVDTIRSAQREDGTAITVHNPLGGTRPLWTVIIGAAGMALLNHDHKLHYDPAPIAQMRQGAAQAIARLVLSHDLKRQPNGGHRLDTLIEQVCGPLSPAAMRDHRRYIRSATTQLAELGIVIDKDRVKRLGKSDAKIASARQIPDGVGHLPVK